MYWNKANLRQWLNGAPNSPEKIFCGGELVDRRSKLLALWVNGDRQKNIPVRVNISGRGGALSFFLPFTPRSRELEPISASWGELRVATYELETRP